VSVDNSISKNILILGVTSAIAEKVARIYALQGYNLFIVGRNRDQLEIIAADLRVRGAQSVTTLAGDLAQVNQMKQQFEKLLGSIDRLDIGLIAYGTLPNQQTTQVDVDELQQAIEVNGTSQLVWSSIIANKLEQQSTGTLAVISSVAGMRGRQSNYSYGAAKGMVSIFLSGLRNRLAKSGISVLDIRPGFVDTPMTAEFPKGPLWASPEKVARDISKAIEKKRDVLYTPFFWRWIMLIVRHIPEVIFKKLSM
jgi:short-subunit dehydrogenase